METGNTWDSLFRKKARTARKVLKKMRDYYMDQQ